MQKTAILLACFGFLLAGFDAQGIGTPPVIAVQPLGVAVQNGGTALLTVTAISLTSMEFKWLFNGQEIANPQVANVVVPLTGTVSTLMISNVSPANAGSYSVKIENGVGEVTSSNVFLIVVADTVPTVLSILTPGTGMKTNGFNIDLSGPAGSNYVIEASTDLNNWTPISTNSAPFGTASYLDTDATNFPSRYYRARLQ